MSDITESQDYFLNRIQQLERELAAERELKDWILRKIKKAKDYAPPTDGRSERSEIQGWMHVLVHSHDALAEWCQMHDKQVKEWKHQLAAEREWRKKAEESFEAWHHYREQHSPGREISLNEAFAAGYARSVKKLSDEQAAREKATTDANRWQRAYLDATERAEKAQAACAGMGALAIKAIESIEAETWDSLYSGNGITSEHERSVSAQVDDCKKRITMDNPGSHLLFALEAADRLADKGEYFEKRSVCGRNHIQQEFLKALADYRQKRGGK